MCLYVRTNATNRLKKRLERKKFVICYKELKIKEGLVSPFTGFCYTWGENKAEGKLCKELPFYSIDENIIYEYRISAGAIHVYTNKKVALSGTFFNKVVIPVKCFAKDFVAAGYSEACFKSVWITKKIYERALRVKTKKEMLEMLRVT